VWVQSCVFGTHTHSKTKNRIEISPPSIICPQWGLWWGRGGHTEVGVTPVTHYGTMDYKPRFLTSYNQQDHKNVLHRSGTSLRVVDCGYFFNLCNPHSWNVSLSWEAKSGIFRLENELKLVSLGSPELALLSQPPLSHPKCTKEGYNAVGIHYAQVS